MNSTPYEIQNNIAEQTSKHIAYFKTTIQELEIAEKHCLDENDDQGYPISGDALTTLGVK